MTSLAAEELSMDEVFAFGCRVVWAPEWGETIYNTVSAGRAKREHWLNVSEPWPDTKFTDIRVRKIGAPHTSEGFKHNAEYRGMPDVRCGDRVKVGDRTGTIVGHNSSANFDVLFDDGPTVNVHPSEVKLNV
jgi:hypothetical protein